MLSHLRKNTTEIIKERKRETWIDGVFLVTHILIQYKLSDGLAVFFEGGVKSFDITSQINAVIKFLRKMGVVKKEDIKKYSMMRK